MHSDLEAEDLAFGNADFRKHHLVLMRERRAGVGYRRTWPDGLRRGSHRGTLCYHGVGTGLCILHFDQQPGRFVGAPGHADQGKIPFELAAMQLHFQVSSVDAFSNALGVRLACQHILVGTFVPNVHPPSAVLPCRRSPL